MPGWSVRFACPAALTPVKVGVGWAGTGRLASGSASAGLPLTIVAWNWPLPVTFVPGTGQEIRFRDYLRESPVEIVVIATQWRAKDIVLEIERHGIPYQRILLEHEGRLVDYHADPHPYR